MGFHISCSGAEFIRRLTRDPEELFGEPFALYIVALCASVDDGMIEGLIEQQMLLDSLTGPYAAFAIFYNDVAVKGTVPSWRPAVRAPFDVMVPPDLIRSGERAVDEVLRHHPDAHTVDSFMIRSTVYASDAIARELGLVGELPCVVVFDNPKGHSFFTIPLEEGCRNIVTDLRDVLASFTSDPASHQFLAALRQWHALSAEIDRVEDEIGRLEQENWGQGPGAIQKDGEELEIAKVLLLNGSPKKFRAEVDRIRGARSRLRIERGTRQVELSWEDIRARSNKVASLIRQSRRLERPRQLAETELPRDRSSHELDGIGASFGGEPTGASPESQARALREEARVEAECLVQDLRLLDQAGSEEAERLSAELVARIELLRAMCDDLKQWRDREIVMIKSLERPRIEPHINRLRREERLSSVLSNARRAGSVAINNAPAILEVIGLYAINLGRCGRIRAGC